MLSRVSVSYSVHGVSEGDRYLRGVGIGALDMGLYPTPLPPPVLTTSGGHLITYRLQVGGMHPAGTLSCFQRMFV